MTALLYLLGVVVFVLAQRYIIENFAHSGTK